MVKEFGRGFLSVTYYLDVEKSSRFLYFGIIVFSVRWLLSIFFYMS